ncbi:MAG: hypothetical protein AAF268_07870 [Cyanobacteria bacterium P01_A01_bin.3]
MPRSRKPFYSRNSLENRRTVTRTPSTPLPKLIQDNAPLQSSNQLLLMYSHFQSEMPADGRTPIGTWLKRNMLEHGLPSLIRFGPRSRPRVFRKDEFQGWLPSI